MNSLIFKLNEIGKEILIYSHKKLFLKIIIKMSRITKELLRKRAEHNEMMLGNLEEIALHQEEIIKIENLD